MFHGAKLNGWFRAYLIFGLVSFLLGFLGYLGTEPPEVSQRFAEQWADFSARIPVLADLDWFGKTAPAFNRFEMPTVLLLDPVADGETRTAAFYAALEAGLKSYAPNIVPISRDAIDAAAPSFANVTPLYRKYLLIGMQAETATHNDFQLSMGVPSHLASELFTKLAAALPDSLAQFSWEQQNIANGLLITVQWRDDPEHSKMKAIAAACLTVFEAARTAAAKGYAL